MTSVLGPRLSSSVGLKQQQQQQQPYYGVRLLSSNEAGGGGQSGDISDMLVRKRMNLPRESGNYDFPSLILQTGGRNNTSGCFVQFNPQARPPADHAPLAPLRHDVPLLDPCSGQLSLGAQVELDIRGGRPQFIDFHHVSSGLWQRPRPPPSSSSSRRQSVALQVDGKTWNSRRIPEAALRASLGGWTSPVKVRPKSHRMPHLCPTRKFQTFFLENDTGAQDSGCLDPRERADYSMAVGRLIYTSMAQRSYEDVGWDSKLPPRFKPPATTLENMADPVSHHVSWRRYDSQPQLWQVVGSQWNRQQLRAREDAKKPISFCSPCPKAGQIPLYCGTIGSVNMDSIDNSQEDFQPLTMLRNSLPPYTPTAHRSTIPGYAGKAAYANSGPGSTESSLPTLSITPSHSAGTNQDVRTPALGHSGHLSRMVTTVTPRNPFLNPRRAVAPV